MSLYNVLTPFFKNNLGLYCGGAYSEVLNLPLCCFELIGGRLLKSVEQPLGVENIYTIIIWASNGD